jgi:hypothetical protein
MKVVVRPQMMIAGRGSPDIVRAAGYDPVLAASHQDFSSEIESMNA